MKSCPVCKAELYDEAVFCTNCGADLRHAEPSQENAIPPQNNAVPPQGNAAYSSPTPPPVNNNAYYNNQAYAYQPLPYDHTHEFDPKDISENKVYCMLTYLLGTIGIIIALLASNNSPYTAFHVRQAAKITVTSYLVGIVSLVLVWTILVPIAGGIFSFVLFIVRIIAFVQICQGKAVEPAIIRSIGLLK